MCASKKCRYTVETSHPYKYAGMSWNICPITQYGSTGYYRDGGGGLALSVYIRKLSLSPSISSQIGLIIYIIVTIPSKLRLVENGLFFYYGQINSSSSSSG